MPSSHSHKNEATYDYINEITPMDVDVPADYGALLEYTADEIRKATDVVVGRMGRARYENMGRERQRVEVIKRLQKVRPTEDKNTKAPKRKREDKVKPPYPVSSDSEDSDYVAMPSTPAEKAAKAAKSHKSKDKDGHKSSKHRTH
ncbi:hypothetical protein F5Y04DRAFT_286344 [Hypomontagnella monticulosa]|nr:hypothetical protein F5Y04DRAFT_286344 [Hypomontagnella monticulosa]